MDGDKFATGGELFLVDDCQRMTAMSEDQDMVVTPR
jgi:hypothetical protein